MEDKADSSSKFGSDYAMDLKLSEKLKEVMFNYSSAVIGVQYLNLFFRFILGFIEMLQVLYFLFASSVYSN